MNEAAGRRLRQSARKYRLMQRQFDEALEPVFGYAALRTSTAGSNHLTDLAAEVQRRNQVGPQGPPQPGSHCSTGLKSGSRIFGYGAITGAVVTHRRGNGFARTRPDGQEFGAHYGRERRIAQRIREKRACSMGFRLVISQFKSLAACRWIPGSGLTG